jgi:hypothetical protein
MAEHHGLTGEAMWGPIDQRLDDIAPRAVGVRFDAATGLVMVTLRTGAVLGFAPAVLPGLQGAEVSAIADVRVVSEGEILTWPSLGAETHVPSLVLSACGSQAWCDQLLDAEWEALRDTVYDMAATLGRKGGASQSAAKTTAARENGKKGGRPRKQPRAGATMEPGGSTP